jgi:branched-chain amino acid transport system substrate-binding protein
MRLKSKSLIKLIPVFVLTLAACQAPAPPAPAAQNAPTQPAAQPTAAPAQPTAAPAQPEPTKAPAEPTAAPAAAIPDVIKVGAVVPLTGRYGAGGAQIKNGYELAVEEINKNGGIEYQGKKLPLELTILDDESDPTKTVQRLETLNSDGVVAYLGGFGSDLHAAAAGIAEKNKVPYLGVAFAFQGVHGKGFKYLFSPFPKSPELAKTTFDLLDSLNPKPTKVFGLIEKTDWGNEMNTEWKGQAEKRGYTYGLEQYAPGSKDFSAVILKAKEAGADVIVSLPNPPDGIAIVKQMKELAVNPKVLVTIRAADGPNWPQNLKLDGDFTLLITGWSNDIGLPGVKEMNAAHVARFNSPATAITGPAYNLVFVLVDALKRAKSIDRESIRVSLTETDMKESLVGPVKFRPDGSSEVLTVVSQYQSGKTVSVWPPGTAATKIIYPAPPFAERK